LDFALRLLFEFIIENELFDNDEDENKELLVFVEVIDEVFDDEHDGRLAVLFFDLLLLLLTCKLLNRACKEGED
jgi:hypothetical protein